ncbi:PIN domain-containing protein [bacterium]|nr:PIN domain-containing protein [bacterium]MCI0605756.1 PIN domain-containing protein [bacterium]
MAAQVFVDTSGWIALVDKSERRHKDVSDAYRKLLTGTQVLVTSDLVLAESHILVRRRLSYSAAETFLESMNTSPSIVIIFMDDSLEQLAKELLKKFRDQELSFTDAASFAIMKARRIHRAVTLDQHFQSAGFKMIP